MFSDKEEVFQPAITSRVSTYYLVPKVLATGLRIVRAYWWWVPLLLLSMLVGSAVASHHKVKPTTEAKPALLVYKANKLLVDQV